LPYSLATTIVYVVFAGALAILLLFLVRRVQKEDLPRELWIPVAFVGTFLFYPRIMKYDMAAITIPMLLIAWRTLTYARDRSRWTRDQILDLIGTNSLSIGQDLGEQAGRHSRLTLPLLAATCFVVPNLMTVAGPPSWPVELVVMLTVFAAGLWTLGGAVTEIEPDEIPVSIVCEEVSPVPVSG
jgi:hypothetical protein